MKHTLTLLSALLFAPFACLSAAGPSKPNIVFILAEYLGWVGIWTVTAASFL